MDLFLGANTTEKYCTYSDTVDCLSCEIHIFRKVTYPDLQDLMQKVKILENNGWVVCVDIDDYFYETKEEMVQCDPYK